MQRNLVYYIYHQNTKKKVFSSGDLLSIFNIGRDKDDSSCNYTHSKYMFTKIVKN